MNIILKELRFCLSFFRTKICSETGGGVGRNRIDRKKHVLDKMYEINYSIMYKMRILKWKYTNNRIQ